MISEGIGIGILAETAVEPSDDVVAISIKDDEQPQFLISKVYRKFTFNLEIYNNIIEVLRILYRKFRFLKASFCFVLIINIFELRVFRYVGPFW